MYYEFRVQTALGSQKAAILTTTTKLELSLVITNSSLPYRTLLVQFAKQDTLKIGFQMLQTFNWEKKKKRDPGQIRSREWPHFSIWVLMNQLNILLVKYESFGNRSWLLIATDFHYLENFGGMVYAQKMSLWSLFMPWIFRSVCSTEVIFLSLSPKDLRDWLHEQEQQHKSIRKLWRTVYLHITKPQDDTNNKNFNQTTTATRDKR